MGKGRGAVVLTTSTLRVREAKHMVVAGSLGFIYIYKHLPFMPAFSVLISPAISPFSAVNIFQLTQVSEGEGKKMLFFFPFIFCMGFLLFSVYGPSGPTWRRTYISQKQAAWEELNHLGRS